MYKRNDNEVVIVDLGNLYQTVTTDGTSYDVTSPILPYLHTSVLGSSETADLKVYYEPTTATTLAAGYKLAFAVALASPASMGITGNLRVQLCASWQHYNNSQNYDMECLFIGQPVAAIANGWHANNALSNFVRDNIQHGLQPGKRMDMQWLVMDLQSGEPFDPDYPIVVGIEMFNSQASAAINVDSSFIHIAARYVLNDVKEYQTGGSL